MCVFFFFEQRTAYWLRISDWSSDVCSSDLIHEHLLPGHGFDGSGGEQLFFFIYYVATGFHGLHVLIGVVLMAVLAQRLGQGRYSARHHPAVELSILY